jgi:hypothetical protein
MELSQELAGNQLLSTVTDHYLQRFGLSPEPENDRETPRKTVAWTSTGECSLADYATRANRLS